MGQSHIKSNVIGYAGTEYIASFNEIKNLTTLTTTNANITTASANVMKASGLSDSSYVQVGVQQYVLVGNSNTGASIVAEATALLSTPLKGSMYMSRKGNLWFFTADTTASPVQSLA